MRPRPLVLATASAVLLLSGGALPAVADPDPSPPSQADVDRAKAAAADKARTVAAVQADLVMAEQRVQDAAIDAASAYEDWNEARVALAEARSEVVAADDRAKQAANALRRQEQAYGAVLAATYEMSPDVTALSALVDENGVQGVIETSNTMYGLTTTMDEVKQSYQAALAVADLATQQAERARKSAADLERKATEARDAAQAMEAAAASEASAVAREKDSLIRELARLQDISVSLAAERQAGLEAAARERAAAAARAEAIAAAKASTAQAAAARPPRPAAAPAAPAPQPAPQPATQPAPAPAPQPDPEPQPDPSPPPPSTSGAQRAIDFARNQIGEPYEWGASGPSSWDCSGLTSEAWQAGGKWIGRTSRSQYAEATPISYSQLRPGDLVFWSDGGADDIYHVGLYIGDDQMIHAPRTGRDVTIDSIWYWVPPSHFARP